jgi:NAD(P)-dependent dehydrogenase (short-subunit alcohol dehydrogenase family)
VLLCGEPSQGFPRHSIISAAKGGVEGLILSLAGELSPSVRVNGVAPSLTDTPLAHGFTSNPALKDGVAKAHPIPRLGTAGERV